MRKKYFAFFILILIGSFFITKKINAASFVQSYGNGYLSSENGIGITGTYFTDNNGNTTKIINGVSSFGFKASSTNLSALFYTGFNSSSTIQSITLSIRYGNSDYAALGNLFYYCRTATGLITGESLNTAASGNYVVFNDKSFTTFTYYFTPQNCDFQNLTRFWLDFSSTSQRDFQYEAANQNIFSGLGIGDAADDDNNYLENYEIKIAINNGSLLASQGPGATFVAPIPTCGPTSFNILGIDFGSEMCKLVQFLFVPDQTVFNQWTNTQALMASKAPFSYFYELTNDLQNLATSTSSTITPLTLNIASGTPMAMSVDIFSANTINRYTDSTSRNTIRTLIQWALYLAFITAIILEVRHLFKTNNPPK